MSFAISSPKQYRQNGNGIGNGVLEVRLLYLERMISGDPPQILHESLPTPFHSSLFYLSLPQLQDPLFYVRQFLSSLDICPDACETMTREIASYIVHMFNESRERSSNFHIIAEFNFVRVIWLEEEPIAGGWGDGGAVVFDEAPVPRRVEMLRKLKSEEKGEELGDCSICLDELKCEKREVIRIPCGHVYHESCIFKWLKNHNSCPLCRNPLPMEDPN